MDGRRRLALLLALVLVGAVLAGCAGQGEAPPAGSATGPDADAAPGNGSDAAPGHGGEAAPGNGGDAARGEGGGESAPPPDPAQPGSEPRLREIYVFRAGELLTAPPAALTESRLVHDVRDMMWVAARGGAGIVAEDSELLPTSALPLASQQRQEGFTDLWVRFEFAPTDGPADRQDPDHGDVMLYVDIGDPADARLAVQDASDPDQWLITPLPGYGAWLEREVDLFIRLSIGS